MKYGTCFLGEQDTRQNTELKKSVVQSVLLCLSCFFHLYFDKFIKAEKKKKIKSLNFAESIKRAPKKQKNKRARQL